MTTPNQMYLGGQWRDASDGGTIDIVNPATEEIIDTAPSATAADLSDVLAAVDAGWRTWRDMDAWSRSAILRDVGEQLSRRIDEISWTLTEEQGKPVEEARSEVQAAVEQFDWYADEARRIYGRTIDSHSRGSRLAVIKQPVGPVAAFTPWNFPLVLPARKIAPALAAGCSIVLKPAEESPRTALWIADACHEAGVPPGVVNIVTGNPSLISSQLIASDVIRKVTLTGSVPVGQRLLKLCADGVKAVTMELGGHAPVLVFEDADVQIAIELSLQAKFRNAGQVCVSPSRFFVHESLVAEFATGLAERVRSLRVGPGTDPLSDVGPLSNKRRLETIEQLVSDAVGGGATVMTGGHRPTELDRGYFYAPTVLSDVKTSMTIMVEEPFGPVAPIVPFSSLQHGLQLANDTSFGLAGYLFTNDLKTAHLAAEGLETGVVGVNNMVIATTEAPFGGVKRSGYGRENGLEGIDAYLITKFINYTLL
jgi:succinate-semialdehyde dehydrogenase / glutarate-semialdehyde dehydrogenase